MSDLMKFLDLAPGDPISQGGSLREFRYSQFSDCPSAPFNTAEAVFLPSQFHLSASLATSPLLEFEGHKCMLKGGRLGEASSSLLCSQRKSDEFAEGVKCNPKCGEHLQSGSKERGSSPRILEEDTQASDVGVSVSAQQDPPLRPPIQRSPRRIYCDPRLLEEETQVFDLGMSVSKQEDLCLLSTTHHLQLDPQSTAGELKMSRLALGVKEGCHVAVEDVADICQRWKNRKRISPPATTVLSSPTCMGLPLEVKQEIIKQSTSIALDVDHFQGQPTGLEPVIPGPPCATNQTTSVTSEDNVDIAQRCRNKRRISLAALTNLNSSTNVRLSMETKHEIIKPGTSDALDADRFRVQPTVVEPEDASPSTSTKQKIFTEVEDDADTVQRWHNRKRVALSAITNLSSSLDKKLKPTPELGVRLQSTELHDQLEKDLLLNDNENRSVPQRGYGIPGMDATSPRSGSETIEEDVNVDDDTDDCCDSILLRRKLNNSCAGDIKSFLQPVTVRNKSTQDNSSSNGMDISKQEHAEEKWIYPKKSRVGGRQRTMDAWIK